MALRSTGAGRKAVLSDLGKISASDGLTLLFYFFLPVQRSKDGRSGVSPSVQRRVGVFRNPPDDPATP